MRAGENRGILSRVLTIYKQTFIFQIFHLCCFWKLKLPHPHPRPFRPVLWVESGDTLLVTLVGTQAQWARSKDSTLPLPHQVSGRGQGKPQDLSSEAHES